LLDDELVEADKVRASIDDLIQRKPHPLHAGPPAMLGRARPKVAGIKLAAMLRHGASPAWLPHQAV
jgi:hypothetical protein